MSENNSSTPFNLNDVLSSMEKKEPIQKTSKYSESPPTPTSNPTTTDTPTSNPTATATPTPTTETPTDNPNVKRVNIIDAIKEYMTKEKLKIIIGTPCYAGNLNIGYFQSTIELTKAFTALNIPFEIMTIGNESLIPRARNGIVSKFMADNDATHLMFIDADITYQWQSIIKLVLLDKDLSGGCYPKKMINWDKVKHNLKTEPEIDDGLLMAKSVDYVFNPIYRQEKMADGRMKLTSTVSNNMIKVKDIGTGFMMIKKNVIEILMYKYEELQYKNNVAGYQTKDNDEYFFTLFDTEIDPVSKVYLSEDYLFCKRWRETGGECWMDLSCCLNHTGIMDFKGAISTTIGQLDMMNKDYKMISERNNKEAKKQ